MNRRLRKKLHRGEYSSRGFVVRWEGEVPDLEALWLEGDDRKLLISTDSQFCVVEPCAVCLGSGGRPLGDEVYQEAKQWLVRALVQRGVTEISCSQVVDLNRLYSRGHPLRVFGDRFIAGPENA